MYMHDIVFKTKRINIILPTYLYTGLYRNLQNHNNYNLYIQGECIILYTRAVKG